MTGFPPSRLPRLMWITSHRQTSGRTLPEIARAFYSAGGRLVQFREPDLPVRTALEEARAIRGAVPEATLLVNDRVDIALAAKADGVHLRQNSPSPALFRQWLEPRALLGASTHSLQEARTALTSLVDYLVFGPIFETPGKLPYGPPAGLSALQDVCRKSTLPVFAVGGITPANASLALKHGAYGIAVIRAIGEAEDPAHATGMFLDLL